MRERKQVKVKYLYNPNREVDLFFFCCCHFIFYLKWCKWVSLFLLCVLKRYILKRIQHISCLSKFATKQTLLMSILMRNITIALFFLLFFYLSTLIIIHRKKFQISNFHAQIMSSLTFFSLSLLFLFLFCRNK